MMKSKQRSMISLVAALLLTTATNVTAQNEQSADEVIRKTADKLASVKNLKYKYRREVNNPSEDYFYESVAESFLDLKAKDNPVGFRFQFFSNELLAIYNGSERFIADKRKQTMIVEDDPPVKSFANLLALYYSPLTLKNVLPRIIADKSVKKTVSIAKIGGLDHYVVGFALDKAAINGLGEIYPLRSDRKTVYRLTVDKKTLLPVEVFVGNELNQDFAKMSFLDITADVREPAENSWYYSTYTNEYRLITPEERILIQSGEIAPDFKLNLYESSSQVSLDQHKGKVVLLEFWIVNCGFCIAAVPRLNVLSRKFREKGVELVSINVHDPLKNIGIFKNKNKPEYPILTDGEPTAIGYGVSAYPTFVVVDKDGKVVYSKPGLFEEELETALTGSL